MGLRVVALLDEQRMRDGVVIQTGDVPERELQPCRRLAVWAEEGASLRGMLIRPHSYMEGTFDRRHGTFDLHIHAVACSTNNHETVRFCKPNSGLIVFAGRSKPLGELRHREEVPVRRAGWIVQTLQK